MARNKKLNLPMNLTEETGEIIGEMWAKKGSIRDCKDVSDFGRYRFALVKLFDKKIKELKKTAKDVAKIQRTIIDGYRRKC